MKQTFRPNRLKIDLKYAMLIMLLQGKTKLFNLIFNFMYLYDLGCGIMKSREQRSCSRNFNLYLTDIVMGTVVMGGKPVSN